MTEHSKIPLPPRKEGESLIERAAGAFGGLGGFKAAPVPKALAAPGNRRVRKPAVKAEASATLEPAAERALRKEVEPQERIPFRAAPQPVDRERLKDRSLIVPGGPVTALVEEFRMVKRQLLLTARDMRLDSTPGAAQRVLVCSPLPGEGKTFCATNLALSIAGEKDSEVVLVDADFGKPSIPGLLGIEVEPGAKGLMDALADPGLKVEDCVIPTDVAGLHVLPAGNRTASDSEYLASSRAAEVLDRLTQGAPNRIVIFDSPPALAATPAAELAKYCGQAVVICRADRTGQSALEDALSLLSACPDIKLLLNSANFSPSGRRFGDYYGYGG